MRIEQGYGIRYSEEAFSEEPKKKYYFACEGEKTEYKYLRGVEKFRNELNLDPLIEIIPIRHGKKTSSNPLSLMNEAEKAIQENCTFSPELDTFVLVVDRDKHSFKASQYDQVLLKMASTPGYSLVVSNPCFELWLFLHHADLKGYDLKDVAENKKVDVDKVTVTKNRTYIVNCLKEKQGGIYSKTNLKFESFYKDKIKIAIANSKKYCLDVTELKDKVGTNFGTLLERMIK